MVTSTSPRRTTQRKARISVILDISSRFFMLQCTSFSSRYTRNARANKPLFSKHEFSEASHPKTHANTTIILTREPSAHSHVPDDTPKKPTLSKPRVLFHLNSSSQFPHAISATFASCLRSNPQKLTTTTNARCKPCRHSRSSGC